MNRKVRLTPRQLAIIAASFSLTTQGMLLAVPPSAKAPVGKTKPQSPAFKFSGKFLKFRGQISVVGLLNGAPVFKSARGEFFQVESGTGDLKFLSPESMAEAKPGATPRQGAVMGKFIKWGRVGSYTRMSILGLDDHGNIIQENTRGEKFYLDTDGDMVFVK